jgi:hypothetical protein
MAAELVVVVRCPHCGHEREETMPTDACQIRSICEPCGEELLPTAGDCCIFSSYGSVRYSPEREEAIARAPLALSPEIRRWHAWRVSRRLSAGHLPQLHPRRPRAAAGPRASHRAS